VDPQVPDVEERGRMTDDRLDVGDGGLRLSR
jgi:hypothetical protein